MTAMSQHSRCRTDAAERALLALVSTGDRRAMDQLYFRYFARLAKFFQNMTLRADVVEELINDTMLEVWRAGESIRPNDSALLAIMGLAYSRVKQCFAEVRADEPHSQRDVRNREQSKSMLATAACSDLQIFLSELPVEERAALYLAHASGCSRRDVLLRAVRAITTLYYC
jgi:DNA-directed RNA polymerase specialized sigma24 family protein